MTASGSKRWLGIAAAAVAVAIVVAATVVWATRDSEPSTDGDDCALVEDVARQWSATQAEVQRILEQGAIDANQTAAQRQSAIGETLRRAADSASSGDIADQLDRWAAGAEKFAQIERDAGNRPPGAPAPADADSGYLSAATESNNASIALGKLCPGMPPLQP